MLTTVLTSPKYSVMKRIIALSLIGIFLSMQSLVAQYFGKNKPRYQNFQFEVLGTPNFDIHYYTKNKEVLDFLAKDSELWYDYHAQALGHNIPFENPIIFYNNHAEFQQTNAISGGIGVGTGGVTEGFKNRVIMPVTFSNQQTHQVLGHELVHAFQFNIIIGNDSTSIRNLSNVPLWIIEGMAEYMSIGRMDPFTAMWMRNAILNDDIPSLADMANPKYFPYRYGQTAWSFMAGTFGDQTLKPFLLETAKYGIEAGSILTFDTGLDNLSNMWENALKNHFTPHLGEMKESRIGKTLLSKDNSGSLNVSPAISPNGRWVVFMSEKDLFSTDIFLADARSGKIEKKLSSLVKDSDLDNFNFLESAGTWSPNSRQFAFIGFKKGKQVLVIKDVESGNTEKTYNIPGLKSITNPTWSPDGREIVVTGSIEGQTDLFAFEYRRNKVRQLTDDKYSEIQANFNTDGSKLVFSYDKRSMTEGRKNGRWSYDLAIMDYASGGIEILDIFKDADNINASYDHEDNIYFLSDRDGYRNMYKYDVSKDQVYRMTDFLTGLSGISRYSPAITAAKKRDRVLFTHYYGREYIIKGATSETLLNEPVEKDAVDFSAGTLPGAGMDKTNIVHANLDNLDAAYVSQNDKEYTPVDYDGKFKLDNISGGVGAGINNGSVFGLNNGLAAQGALQMSFSDLLGNHQLIGQAALNGGIQDLGGQIFYINRKGKLAWGGGISHVPQRFGLRQNVYTEAIPINGGGRIPAIIRDVSILTVFDQTLSGFVQMPFSSSLRLEGGASIGNQGFRVDTLRSIFDQNGFFLTQGNIKAQDLPDEVSFNQFYTVASGLEGGVNVALVGDNSYFGLTSPLYGHRFRLSASRSFGINNFTALTADYRKYHWAKPFSFAIRGFFLKRFQDNVKSVFPIYIGQMGLVRGYDFIFNNNRQAGEFGGVGFDQLLGSSAGLVSAEVRVPFTGPKQLSLIGSKFLLTDLALFFDAGMAFNEFSDIGREDPGAPELAMSVGASVRVNLFGSLILEPYWAYPLQSDSKVVFGLNFIPGW